MSHKIRSLKSSLFLFNTLSILFIALLFLIIVLTSSSIQIKSGVMNSTINTMENIGTMIDHSLDTVYHQVEAVTQLRAFYLLQYSLYNPKTNFTPYEYIDLNNAIQNFHAQNSAVLDSSFLYLNDNSIRFYYGNNTVKRITFDKDDYSYPQPSGMVMWSLPDAKPLYEATNPTVNYLSLVVTLGDETSLKQGFFLATIDNKYLENLLATQKLVPGSTMFLTYGQARIGNNAQDNEPFDLTFFEREEPETRYEQSSINIYEIADRFIFHKSLNVPNLSLVITLPKAETKMRSSYLFVLIGLFLLIGLFVSMFIHIIYNRVFAKPILDLTEKIQSAGEGNLDTSFDIHGIEEINTINDNLETLLKRIKVLINQVEQEQEEKRILEIKAFQSQIQPHFLYNTLYSIRQLCSLNEIGKSKRMIDSLASFYRIRIDKGKQVISVGEELEHVRSYLEIQLMNLENQFKYEIDVDPTLLATQIPQLTLQPLVENALQHGIIPNQLNGTLYITTELNEDNLEIYVSDDGLGMSSERCEQVNKEISTPSSQTTDASIYGLRNVHQRLRLTFGEQYGLTVISRYMQGTTVVVLIPFTDNQGS